MSIFLAYSSRSFFIPAISFSRFVRRCFARSSSMSVSLSSAFVSAFVASSASVSGTSPPVAPPPAVPPFPPVMASRSPPEMPFRRFRAACKASSIAAFLSAFPAIRFSALSTSPSIAPRLYMLELLINSFSRFSASRSASSAEISEFTCNSADFFSSLLKLRCASAVKISFPWMSSSIDQYLLP